MGIGTMALLAGNVLLLLTLGYALFRIQRSERWQYTVEHNRRGATIRKQDEELSVLRDLAAEAASHREAQFMPGDGWAESRDGTQLDCRVNQWLDLLESRENAWREYLAAE